MQARIVGAAVLVVGSSLLAGCSGDVTGNDGVGVTVIRGGATTVVPPDQATSDSRWALPETSSSAPRSSSRHPSSAASSATTGPTAIADNGNGYTFVQTTTGKTQCRVSANAAGCQLIFDRPGPRTESGDAANGVNVGSDGVLTFVLGDIGVADPVTLEYRTYTARGWTIEASVRGTRFTNQSTGHGMFVSTEGASAF